MSKRYTQGFAFTRVVILDNGNPISITEIILKLNKLDDLENGDIADDSSRFNQVWDELQEWIYENEKPTNIRCDGRKTMTAHYLLKHIKKNYNISKK